MNVAVAQKRQDSARLANRLAYRSQLYQYKNFFVGASFRTNVRSLEDVDLQLVELSQLTRTSAMIRLDLGYFIKKNWAFGVVGSYSRSRTEIDFLNLENVSVHHQGASERYSLYLTSKNFIPLNENGKFIFFAQTMVGGNWRNQVSENLSNGLLQRSFSQRRQIELVLQPGVAFNVIKGFNIELATELLNVGSQWSQSYINGEPTSSSSKFNTSLRINVFQTNLVFFIISINSVSAAVMKINFTTIALSALY